MESIMNLSLQQKGINKLNLPLIVNKITSGFPEHLPRHPHQESKPFTPSSISMKLVKKNGLPFILGSFFFCFFFFGGGGGVGGWEKNLLYIMCICIYIYINISFEKSCTKAKKHLPNHLMMLCIRHFGRKHRQIIYRNSSIACVWMCVILLTTAGHTFWGSTLTIISKSIQQTNPSKTARKVPIHVKSCNAKVLGKPIKNLSSQGRKKKTSHLNPAISVEPTASLPTLRAWGTAGPQQYSLWKLVQQKKYSNLKRWSRYRNRRGWSQVVQWLGWVVQWLGWNPTQPLENDQWWWFLRILRRSHDILLIKRHQWRPKALRLNTLQLSLKSLKLFL